MVSKKSVLNRKSLFFVMSLFFSLLICGFIIFTISRSRTFQFFDNLTARVNTSEKVVALTFDDAPTSHTNEVLQILADKKIKATFYVIGKNIEQNPSEAKAIIQKGHEIGNHSYSHVRMVFQSWGFLKNEIQKTNSLIRSNGYTGEITFRPPYGKKLLLLPWYLNTLKMKTIMWDVEPDTYYKGDSNKITSYVLNSVKPGSIIVIHPLCDADCSADRQSLPQIIDGLKARGYKFVTISQLLSRKSK